ncbi:MAG: BrnT family toxin [Geminicoccaceae bacterium]
MLEVPSRKETNERRFLAIGEVDGRVITVVYTSRGERRRLITARRARRHEAEDYKAKTGRDR